MKDRKKSLYDRLKAGELVVGVEAASGSPGSVEVVGGLSFDFVVVDARYAAVSPYSDELERVIRAADVNGMPVLVRVGDNTPGTINRAMNDGASGVVVAVDNAEDAELAAKSVRYPPFGFRGAAPVVRAARFGLTPWDDYREATNSQRPVIGSIESVAALENVAEIAAVEGIDAVILDGLNLSLSLGETPFHSPAHNDAIGGAVAQLRAADRVVGVNLLSPNGVEAWRDAGCSLLIIGTDVGAYAEATTALRSDLDSVPTRLGEASGPGKESGS